MRKRLNMLAGESVRGWMPPSLSRFVSEKARRSVDASSQPAWSARLNLINRTPEGFQLLAEEGLKVTPLRAMMYDAVFRPAKWRPSISLSSEPAM